MPSNNLKSSQKNKGKKRISIQPFSYRPRKDLEPRFLNVVKVSKRSKASVVHEGLEKVLPELETKFSAQLRQLNKSEAKAA